MHEGIVREQELQVHRPGQAFAGWIVVAVLFLLLSLA
jgi:hypothetical protein